MDKVFVLSRRTLIGRSRNLWTSYRTLMIYGNKKEAEEECMFLRRSAILNSDDTVDFCVI